MSGVLDVIPESSEDESDSLAGLTNAATLPPSREEAPSVGGSGGGERVPFPSSEAESQGTLRSATDGSTTSSSSAAQDTVAHDMETYRSQFSEAKSLYLSGQSLSPSNPYAATHHFRQAASVFSTIPGERKRVEKSLWKAAMCFARVGMEAARRGEGERARAGLGEAATLFQFVGATSKEAMALYQLALVTEDLLAAAELIKRAASLYADLGDEPHEAQCYAEAAHLFSPSDADTAIFFLKQCLLLYMKLSDKLKEAKALFAIATLASHLDKATAQRYYFQARVLFIQLGNDFEHGSCSYQLGKLAVSAKAYESAVSYFEESSTLFRQAQTPVDEAWSMYRCALVMLKVKTPELAVDYLAEARKLFSESPDERQAEGSCLMRIGEILLPTNPVLAKQYLEEAITYTHSQRERIGRRSTMVLKKLEKREAAREVLGSGGTAGSRGGTKGKGTGGGQDGGEAVGEGAKGKGERERKVSGPAWWAVKGD